MRIGIDFDNTLVNYDLIFDSIARQMGLEAGQNSKEAVKNYLIHKCGDLQEWKKVQASVYGELISTARFLPDFVNFFEYSKHNSIDIFIISYKTEYASYKQARVSLHKAANLWLDTNLSFFKKENVYFETTVTKKIRRIGSLNLDYYIDDLLTILYHKEFPSNVKKILFSNNADSYVKKKKKLPVINKWTQVIEIIEKDKILNLG